MKNILVLSFILLFTSCDPVVFYRFIIINETDNNLVIKTSTKIYDNGFHFPDSIHVVKKGDKIEFFQELGICNIHYIPDDIYMAEDTIPKTSKFDMYINGELQKALRLRANWEFVNKKLEGIYSLHVTVEDVEKKQ